MQWFENPLFQLSYVTISHPTQACSSSIIPRYNDWYHFLTTSYVSSSALFLKSTLNILTIKTKTCLHSEINAYYIYDIINISLLKNICNSIPDFYIICI